jgi:hypothetical protein
MLAIAGGGLASDCRSFEAEIAGLHEHRVEAREQVTPMREQPLLNQSLDATDVVRPS